MPKLRYFSSSSLRRGGGIRSPYKGDKVILNKKYISEKNGLLPNQIVTIIDIDKRDENYYYRVNLLESHYTAWFAKSDLILYDPLAIRPKPIAPENNQCCGSECQDCVWIQYWEDMNEWEAQQKE